MKFERTFTETVVNFGYIKDTKIIRGEEVFIGKKPLERVRASIKEKYGSILVEPKVSYRETTYIFDTEKAEKKKGEVKNVY